MEIETMADLKSALNQVPDKVLKNFVVGCQTENEGEIGLGSTEGVDEDTDKYYERDLKAYEELRKIDEYFKAVGKEAKNEETEGEPVTTRRKD